MALQKKLAGGFTALNSGRIADCYSKVILRTVAGMVRGGFCGENRGTLERCAAQGRVPGKGEKGGLCARQNGRCRQSIWVRTEDLEEADWQDWSYSVDGGGIWEETLPEWDLKECWHTEGGLGLYDRPASCDGFQRIVPIRNRKELLECVQQLNGSPADPGTLYRLEADLDLGGMTWTPIGLDANTPFEGCFDGGGHLIRNFVLNSRRNPYAGFFGWTVRAARSKTWLWTASCWAEAASPPHFAATMREPSPTAPSASTAPLHAAPAAWPLRTAASSPIQPR